MSMELQPGRRQFVKFTFFKVMPEWRRLDELECDRQLRQFRGVVEDWMERNLIRCYSTIGTRGDVDFLIWQVSYELSDLNQMASELLGTELGGWVTTPYSYLSMTKHSQYVEKYSGPGRDKVTRLSLAPG